MASKLVLLTGVNGFLGGHVAEALLQSGFRVRGTARPDKAKLLQESVNIPNLEIVTVEDVATSDLSEVLKDVYAVVHVASPLPGKTSTATIVKDTIEGTMNVIRQGEKAGVKKFVITSTFGALFDASLRPAFGGQTFNESNWSPTTAEDVVAKPNDGFFAYFGLKALAEKSAWDFARAHPHIDLATILPGFMYGSWAESFPLPGKNGPLGTNSFIGALIAGRSPPGAPPFTADVHDVALAHVRAISVPAAANLEDKRFIINGGNFHFRDVAAHIQKARKALIDEGVITVTDPLTVSDVPGPVATLDTTRAKTVLNFTEFVSPQKTVEDTVDAIVALK